jgi:hypothetical protein
MLKRGIQVLILAILVSVNWQLGARAVEQDACETNGPQWCCENIVCPIELSLCILAGGSQMPCEWNGSNCVIGWCMS